MGRRYSIVQTIIDRTEMYNSNVRLWYESYFLTRRTIFIALSLALSHSPELRAVRDDHRPSYGTALGVTGLYYAHWNTQFV